MNTSKLTVCVLDNGSRLLLNRTLDSLKAQTDREFEYKVVDFSAFWSENRNSLQFDAQYVMYLYSGSVLEKDAVESILKTIQKTNPQWMYCDERTYSAEMTRDISGVYEKPDFGVVGFAGNAYTGEGVIFSRQILNGMHLKYDGNNFAVALLEMGIAAAAQADAEHIAQCLLLRHRRPEISADEQKLLTDALKDFLSARDLKLLGVRKSDVLGLYLYPEKTRKKISLILMSESKLDTDEYPFEYLDEDIEVVLPDVSLPYWEKCMQGAQKASHELLCFMHAECTLPDRESIDALINYASLPYIGMVSPCLHDEQTITYTGTYSQAGKCFQMAKTRENMQRFGADLFGVRETAMPAWQFWMAEKELVLRMMESVANVPGVTTLPTEYIIMEFAYQAKSMGRSNLYLGNVSVSCEQGSLNSDAEGFCNLFFRWKDKFFLDPYCPRSMRLWMRENMLKDVKAYFPENMEPFDPERKKIFVLTHELSLTGAPVVLTHAVRMLKNDGWQVVVVSPADGVLKKDFLRDGLPVFIQPDMDQNDDWMRLAADFDLIFVNTIVPFRQIEQLRDFKVPVMWWLHDARSGYEDYLQYVLPETIGDNIHTFSVSKYADDVVREFRPKYKTSLLLYGLKDEAARVKDEQRPIEDANGRKVFVSVGTVIHRKGQDILTEAVRLLPEEIRKQCLFLFIGKCIDMDIFRYVKELEKDYPDEVRQIDAVPHDEIFNLYKEAAAVICSSRDDPLPTFMAETMMVSGVCICSENTGTAGVIENGKNGYVYKNDDPVELAQCIQFVVERDELDTLKKESRKTFEDVFSIDVFKKNLLNSVASCINHAEGDESNA